MKNVGSGKIAKIEDAAREIERTRILLSNLPVIWGKGNPEGIESAKVGTLYANLQGGVVSTLYLKVSGDTGSGGWKPVSCSDFNVTTVKNVTTLTTLQAGFISGDLSTAAFTTMLPSAVGNLGLTYTLKYSAGTFAWTISAAAGELIDDQPSIVLTKLNQSVTLRSDGVKWCVVATGSLPELDEHEYPAVITKATLGLTNAHTVIGIHPLMHKNKIYFGSTCATAATDATGACVIVYDIATATWSLITKATIGFVNADTTIAPLFIYNDLVWFGTYNATVASDGTGASVASFDGVSTWTRYTKATMGAHANDVYLGTGTVVCGAGVFNGSAYIGTYSATAATDATGAKLIRLTGSVWSTITKATIGAHANDLGLGGMQEYDGYFWIGTYNVTASTDATGAKLIRLSTAGAWTTYTKATMGGVNADQGIGIANSMAVHKGMLHAGTWNGTAAVDATASKLLQIQGGANPTFNYLVKSQFLMNNADYFAAMLIQNNKLFFSAYSSTAAVNSTGSTIRGYGTSLYPWQLYVKSMLGGVNADIFGYGLGLGGGYIWAGTYNATASTDASGAKIIKWKIPKYQGNIGATWRGF